MSKLRILFVVAVIGCSKSPAVSLPTQAAEWDNNSFPKLSVERDWAWWRGPSRNGVAPESAKPPTHWSETENVVWKTPVPGRGHSSPTVVGERVYLTTAEESEQIQSVVAFDRATGNQAWQREISRGGFPRAIHSKNTHATPTVACDGERLIVTFFHHETVQAAALDFSGNIMWRKTLGPFNPQRYEYGYAPSPVPYKSTFIVASEYDGDSFLAAFDRATGEEKWRTSRPNNISFSTPLVAHVAGRDQLLLSGAERVSSYDPDTGEQLWSTAATTAATCGTMVWDGDLVFASGGYPKSETCCIRADGSGTVVWKNRQKCYEQSMIVVGGYLYAFTDQGVMYCWRTTDGEERWSERLGGPVSSSPVFAGGHIYWANERGEMFVFRPNGDRYEQAAANRVGEEGFATPAVSGNQLFWRTASGSGGQRREWLYCFGAR